jgi:hypothetical protein
MIRNTFYRNLSIVFTKPFLCLPVNIVYYAVNDDYCLPSHPSLRRSELFHWLKKIVGNKFPKKYFYLWLPIVSHYFICIQYIDRHRLRQSILLSTMVLETISFICLQITWSKGLVSSVIWNGCPENNSLTLIPGHLTQ